MSVSGHAVTVTRLRAIQFESNVLSPVQTRAHYQSMSFVIKSSFPVFLPYPVLALCGSFLPLTLPGPEAELGVLSGFLLVDQPIYSLPLTP